MLHACYQYGDRFFAITPHKTRSNPTTTTATRRSTSLRTDYGDRSSPLRQLFIAISIISQPSSSTRTSFGLLCFDYCSSSQQDNLQKIINSSTTYFQHYYYSTYSTRSPRHQLGERRSRSSSSCAFLASLLYLGFGGGCIFLYFPSVGFVVRRVFSHEYVLRKITHDEHCCMPSRIHTSAFCYRLFLSFPQLSFL